MSIMLYLIFPVYLVISITLLGLGLKLPNRRLLSGLSLLWIIGALLLAPLTFFAWQERAYSENWASLGLIFVSIPYCLITFLLLGFKIWFIRRWSREDAGLIRRFSLLLAILLGLHLIIGALLLF